MKPSSERAREREEKNKEAVMKRSPPLPPRKRKTEALLQFARDNLSIRFSIDVDDVLSSRRRKRRRNKYFQIQTPNSSNTTRSRKISMFTGRTSKT